MKKNVKYIKSRYDEALDEQSKNCYPGTNILINKLNIQNALELDKVERSITTLVLVDIQFREIPDTCKFFSVDYYLSLHKDVFQYVYDFAGKIRDENIVKGSTPFCRPEYVYYNLNDTLQSMRKTISFIDEREDLLNWLAYSYAQLNIIHPFREGNGRVAREYLREAVELVNKERGFNYELNLSGIDDRMRKYFINASIVSAKKGDNQWFKKFFNLYLREKDNVKEINEINTDKKGR